MPAPDSAQFLADSPDRLRLLTHLRETPASPSTLAEALSISHRSAQRNLSQFVEKDWAKKDEGVYHLTPTGELIAEEHEDYIGTLERIHEFEPFYRHLPDSSHAPDPRWLQDATLAVATPDNSQAPVHHYATSLQNFETETIRMISPGLSRLFHNVHAELGFRGVQTDLVMSSAMIERARELNPTEFKIVISVNILDLYRHPDDIGFALTLGDDRLLMGAYDAEGQLQACLDTSDPDVLGWATQLYDRYRERSTQVEPPMSLPLHHLQS